MIVLCVVLHLDLEHIFLCRWTLRLLELGRSLLGWVGLRKRTRLLGVVIFLRAFVRMDDVARIVAQVLLTVHGGLVLDRLDGAGATTPIAEVLLLRVLHHDGRWDFLR